jgi:hypothetical protein
MKSLCPKLLAILALGTIWSLAAAQMTLSQTSNAAPVTLSPGDDLQLAVNSAPQGTPFILTAGVYRMQSVKPKAGDSFTGQGTVTLNGSQLLTFSAGPGGSGLWVATAVAHTGFHGFCQTAFPLCGYAQDLFIDNVLQVPAGKSQGLKAGSWYFDRTNNAVYLPANPNGHLVEMGMSHYAIYGSAANVQINNLTIEKYAASAQFGAIGGDSSGTGWVVNNVEARWNHGRGISLGSGSVISNSFIHHNGQLGIWFYGANCIASGNEISWNNQAGFSTAWEAGGSKFWGTSNLTVKSNYVHDNNGPGLWTDTDNVGTLYDSNTVMHNHSGISHEVSYAAIIRNNMVKGNGTSASTWLWGAQINIQNSSHVQVYGNTLEVPAEGGNGIAIINQKRGSGALGAWVASNNSIHNNTVTFLGSTGVSGVADDSGENNAVNNQFDTDHYVEQDGGNSHWYWFGTMNWEQFQSSGQEAHGSCCD